MFRVLGSSSPNAIAGIHVVVVRVNSLSDGLCIVWSSNLYGDIGVR